MTRIMDNDISNPHTSTIMKELSDIKASLAVNTNETANIKATISEIKTDVNTIKNDAVTRREFTEIVNNMSNQGKDIQFLQRVAYGGLAILGAIQFYFNVIQ